MANRRSGKECTSIRICIGKDLNKAVEKFKIDEDEPLSKSDAASKFIQQIYELAKPLMK